MSSGTHALAPLAAGGIEVGSAEQRSWGGRLCAALASVESALAEAEWGASTVIAGDGLK